MLQRRRVLIALLLALFALLGFILFGSVRPSTMFSIAAPPAKPTQTETLPAGVSGTISGPLGQVSGTTMLEKPRYTGQDALGRNWTVNAENALQGGSAKQGVYILQDMTAQWSDPSQTTPFTLSAKEGTYSQTSATVTMTGNVQATGMDLTLTAPQMDADLTTRTVHATGGSRVQGTVGGDGTRGWNVDIASPDLVATPSSSILLFTGGVRAKLTPSN